MCRFVETATALIIMGICSAGTIALPDAEENTAGLAVSHTHFHFGLASGYLGMLVDETFQIRVPIKVELVAPVKLVCTRPSTADIQAIKQTWRRLELLHKAGFVPGWWRNAARMATQLQLR